MIEEIQFCVQQFRKMLPEVMGAKSLLIGENEYIQEIQEIYNFFPKENVIVTNRENDDLEFLNTPNIETIYILGNNLWTEMLYSQMANVCLSRNIAVYNGYGKDMFLLRNDASIKNGEYANLSGGDLYLEIDAAERVSFDIDNVLFGVRYSNVNDFEAELERQLHYENLEIYCITERIRNERAVDPYISLGDIVDKMVSESFMTSAHEKVERAILSAARNAFYPRKQIFKTLKYALCQGKKVFIVEDMPQYRLGASIWSRLLNENGVEGFYIISGTQQHLNKYDGLYRSMLQNKDGEKSLHIGDELESDIIIPQLYGIRTFLVKSPQTLYEIFKPQNTDLPEGKLIQDLWEKYVHRMFTDEYLISVIQQKKEKEKNSVFGLEDQINFYRNHPEIELDELIEYEPYFVDDIDKSARLEEYPILSFKEYSDPCVSIIIPVYNQFRYTYNCLHAILCNTEKIEYEIILADDNSTDNVSCIEKVVRGITVLHNAENLRFLLNCNNAAKRARGKYLLFLNNDTQVQPDWLYPLVHLMEGDKKIGMVGSKLVYPDGHLQEAGGILWRDGSAWNYGHLGNPNNPEFSYVKEVDYISGASIMIRKNIWDLLGGFDSNFAPAYYEDTDLAFAVRKIGYKVLFQPQSIVVHFEGVSNGTDLSSGLKKYQVQNKEKFFQKWKDVLNKEHFENGNNVFLAKDRGQKKTQILVIDHYVPNFDRDAGGRCTFMYIKTFLKMGFKVTFLGDNFAKPQPYTDILNQMGVEVLYGDYYCLNWEQWLKDNAKYFHYIYLQRPHISVKYMDIAKEYSQAKVFYFAHDLHHVRMYRDYLVSGNRDALYESEKWKQIELDLFDKADIGHVVGSYEQELMQKYFPDKPIRNIPLYIYEKMPEEIEKDFSQRKDILFVGGFSHLPNIDAVIWFARHVFPSIIKVYPDIKWYIVGSNAPQNIKDLAADIKNITLRGYISDEELSLLYRKCRMVVVPLRYGAGVKGKIVEAAYYQIPVVTTSIGGEGIDDTIGAFIMEDDENKMAEQIVSLYSDFKLLRTMSDAGQELVKKYFSVKTAEEVLQKDMNL